MKKVLLVLLIGMVLVMDVCGIVKEAIEYFNETEEVNEVHGTIVYVE